MRKWWIGVALTVGWLSAAAAGRGQGPMPEPMPTWPPASAPGQGRPMLPTGPMPTPVGPMPGGGGRGAPLPVPPGSGLGFPGGMLPGMPPGMPPGNGPGAMSGFPPALPPPGGDPSCAPDTLGPLGPDQAPPGPGPDLSISAGAHGAFMEDQPETQAGVYAHAGVVGLVRQRLGHGGVAWVNSRAISQLDTGLLPRPRQAAMIDDWNDITPDMGWGPTATVGVMKDNWALEASGFYIVDHSDSDTSFLIGGLIVPFTNIPLGFEGDNGLWNQADAVQMRLWSNVVSGEVNFRCWNQAFTGPELIIGARYFGADERVSIITDDDLFTVRDINGMPDPRRRATYSVRTKNRMIGGQAGFEWNKVLLPCVTLNCMAKGAWGPNLWQGRWSLVRGDGYEGLNLKQNATIFSQLYVFMFERMKLRAGYQALWFLNVGEAVDQVNFDLEAQGTDRNTTGSIFYHGPRIELQILF
jgi:hypothetical protein